MNAAAVTIPARAVTVTPSAAHAVLISGLTKRYGRITAVAELNLEIEQGSLFGLLGPNGAGKSTTFGILCGWLRADAGSALVLGKPATAPHLSRGRVAALPQDAAFPKQIAIVDEVAHYALLSGVARERTHAEALRVLDLVGLADCAERRGGELSHGMLKRVGLAQALVGEPELLLLDEPTAGLDPASARLIKDVVRALVPRTTVVISSHNLVDIQELCTHGAILDKGKLVTAGTIAALTRQGSEITIELGVGEVPMEALQRACGAEAVALRAGRLRLTCAPGREPAEVIAVALRLLLEHGTPILGVSRGTTLEAAYLDATRGQT
jgi:ABC-2 type transport system ATP-binding protein